MALYRRNLDSPSQLERRQRTRELIIPFKDYTPLECCSRVVKGHRASEGFDHFNFISHDELG